MFYQFLQPTFNNRVVGSITIEPTRKKRSITEVRRVSKLITSKNDIEAITNYSNFYFEPIRIIQNNLNIESIISESFLTFDLLKIISLDYYMEILDNIILDLRDKREYNDKEILDTVLKTVSKYFDYVDFDKKYIDFIAYNIVKFSSYNDLEIEKILKQLENLEDKISQFIDISLDADDIEKKYKSLSLSFSRIIKTVENINLINYSQENTVKNTIQNIKDIFIKYDKNIWNNKSDFNLEEIMESLNEIIELILHINNIIRYDESNNILTSPEEGE